MSRFTTGKVTVTRKAQAPNPATDPARVAVALRKRDRSFKARWITLAILGFLVLWIGPVVFGSIVYLARMRESYTPWVTCFLWTSLIVLPILFFFEWMTRGKFFDNTVEGLGDVGDYGYYAKVSTFHMRGRVAAGALAIEVCLWGPRMAIAGFQRIAALSRVKPRDHEPAAAVLAQLMRHQEGQPTAQVMTAAALHPDDFSAALAYLGFHEIVGISQDGLRLWVLSEARKQITAAAASSPAAG
jgi:hypothetical protein